MLHGKALWGEAMRAELSQFREQGYFLSPEPLIDAETMALIDKLQREIEPEWRATVFPPGINRQAAQFLMVLKAGGERLLALVEDSATLALAAELLQLEERTVGGRGTAGGLVMCACGMGEPEEWLSQPEGQRVQWHVDVTPGQDPDNVAFRTVIDEQGEPPLATTSWVAFFSRWRFDRGQGRTPPTPPYA